MFEMNGREFKIILTVCGYSQREYSEFINKSRSFVNNCLGLRRIIPPRYVETLKQFLGQEAFDYGLKKVIDFRKKEEDSNR